MGVAIVVPEVDWSDKSVAQVTIVGGEVPDPTIPAEVRIMYTSYLSKTGRATNDNLLNMLAELYAASVLSKSTGLFYLASPENNLEHVKYSIINLRALTVNNTPLVTATGTGGTTKAGDFTDTGGYNLSAKGLLVVFMLSAAPTGTGIDWGADANKVCAFVSNGRDGNYISNTIMVWSDGTAISTTEDATEKKGVYSYYVKGTSARFKHNTVDLTKTLTASSTNPWNPKLLTYGSVNNRTTAVHKMYATFNNDMTVDEINAIHGIFEKYKDLI
ncbi:hypothetical protein IR083_04385 [Dysgonomonas sp. GY75]|uniref:hypothetical protein n=1 Tax=Dysgonomonas sp. GY75 TaxID=2780419 RepID=UPI001884215C|nr:hypothetical protein [Dysgonomonas sp. GY75]MBF0648047.1 hypothetical protein [Dysgonomonas sp. GY75]